MTICTWHAPTAGLQLGSVRSGSPLVHADAIVYAVTLLSWAPHGLRQSIDGMQDLFQRSSLSAVLTGKDLCQHMGLTISPTKTELEICRMASSRTWHVGSTQLPVPASFKYPGLIFHKPGSMTPGL